MTSNSRELENHKVCADVCGVMQKLKMVIVITGSSATPWALYIMVLCVA